MSQGQKIVVESADAANDDPFPAPVDESLRVQCKEANEKATKEYNDRLEAWKTGRSASASSSSICDSAKSDWAKNDSVENGSVKNDPVEKHLAKTDPSDDALSGIKVSKM